MFSAEKLLDLVTKLYDSAADESLWPIFLDSLSDNLNGSAIAVAYHDIGAASGNIAVASRLDPEFVKLYMQYYVKLDPWRSNWVKRYRAASAETIVSSEQLVDHRTLKRTEFFNDYLEPQDTVHQMGGPVVWNQSRGAIVTCLRSWDKGPFAEEELQLLRTLFPHFQRTMEFHARMSGLEGRHRASLDALDLVSSGVFLLDQRGRIVQTNRAARQILEKNDGLTATTEALVGADQEQTGKVRGAIARSTSVSPGLRSRATETIARPSGKRHFLLTAVPASGYAFPSSHARPAVILFVVDPETTPLTNREALASLYDLTPAESRVAEMLAKGETLKALAENLEISHNTARTHLSRIYQKTGTCHQGELVRLLLAGGLPSSLGSS